MAVRNEGAVHNYVAGSAVETNRLVKVTAEGSVEYATDGTAPIVGAVTPKDDAPAGTHVAVQGHGIGQVEAHGAIAVGDPLTAQADGRATTAGVGAYIVGFAIMSASAQGEIISFTFAKGQLA